MNFFTKLFRSRDKPTNSYHFSGWPFVFGKSAAGANVNEFTAMQTTAVYACVRKNKAWSTARKGGVFA